MKRLVEKTLFLIQKLVQTMNKLYFYWVMKSVTLNIRFLTLNWRNIFSSQGPIKCPWVLGFFGPKTHGHKKRHMGLGSGHGNHFSMGLGMGTKKNSRAHQWWVENFVWRSRCQQNMCTTSIQILRQHKFVEVRQVFDKCLKYFWSAIQFFIKLDLNDY